MFDKLLYVLSHHSDNDLFTYLFMGVSVLLALIWRDFLVMLVHKVRELFLSSDWRSFQAENSKTGSKLRIFLAIINLLSVSILLFQLGAFYLESSPPYLVLLIGVAIVHLVRIIISALVNYIFTLQEAFNIWLDTYGWIHSICGVIALPISILLTYSPMFTIEFSTYFILICFILAESLLIYRLVTVFYTGIVSFLYLFLYLCTLEILPILWAYRLL